MFHRQGSERMVLELGEKMIQAKQMMILAYVSKEMENDAKKREENGLQEENKEDNQKEQQP
jgi:hypothetical protein